MKIKLPGVLKKLKPMHWALIGGVVLAALFLYSKKGSGASGVPNTGVGGVGGTGGGGGSSDTGVPAVTGQPPVDWMALLAQQQAAQDAANAAWQAQLIGLIGGGSGGGTGTLPGGGTIPGGTQSPNSGLPGGVQLPTGFSLLPGGGATAGLTGSSPYLGGPAWQNSNIGTSANPPSLSSPSSDTNGLLNQYLYVYNNWGSGKLPSDTYPIFNDLANVKAQIVQLMGSTLMSGPSYTGGMGYAVSGADVTTAQKLASETNSYMNYNPDLLNALTRGLPGYSVNGPIPGASTGSYGGSFGVTGGSPGPAISTGGTTPGAAATTVARVLSLTEFNAANRAAIISRGAGGVSTAGVNATVRSDYDKYLASLK
jgi:hypothetical protein